MAEYPEHEKLSKIKDDSQRLGNFLEWLNEKGYTICEYFGTSEETFSPVRKRTEQWLAEYFEIDLDKIEAEKSHMLDNLRSKQKGGK